jgi:putative SOS response-associated peptidase YedK
VCGRFTSTPEAAQLAERFTVEIPEAYRPRYNAAPAQSVLAVIAEPETGARRAALMRWGLVPHWAKEPSIGYKLINARAETVRDKPAYRSLLAKRRCLLPADGFYEWRVGADGKKEPVRFTLADGELFAFAGLWTHWIDRESGELLESCTVLTTRPNALVASVHDRMPVILPREAEERWLAAELDPRAACELLVPYPAELMVARLASRRANNAREDDPGVLEPDALAA